MRLNRTTLGMVLMGAGTLLGFVVGAVGGCSASRTPSASTSPQPAPQAAEAVAYKNGRPLTSSQLQAQREYVARAARKKREKDARDAQARLFDARMQDLQWRQRGATFTVGKPAPTRPTASLPITSSYTPPPTTYTPPPTRFEPVSAAAPAPEFSLTPQEEPRVPTNGAGSQGQPEFPYTYRPDPPTDYQYRQRQPNYTASGNRLYTTGSGQQYYYPGRRTGSSGGTRTSGGGGSSSGRSAGFGHYCGATTKKGGSCKRWVVNSDYCYQHGG